MQPSESPEVQPSESVVSKQITKEVGPCNVRITNFNRGRNYMISFVVAGSRMITSIHLTSSEMAKLLRHIAEAMVLTDEPE